MLLEIINISKNPSTSITKFITQRDSKFKELSNLSLESYYSEFKRSFTNMKKLFESLRISEYESNSSGGVGGLITGDVVTTELKNLDYKSIKELLLEYDMNADLANGLGFSINKPSYSIVVNRYGNNYSLLLTESIKNEPLHNIVKTLELDTGCSMTNYEYTITNNEVVVDRFIISLSYKRLYYAFIYDFTGNCVYLNLYKLRPHNVMFSVPNDMLVYEASEISHYTVLDLFKTAITKLKT